MTAESPPTPIVFIANRGEIAVRVIRAARDLGYLTATIHVADDAEALYVSMADATERVDSSPMPFLDAELLVAAAIRAGAEFVHPGYGFLAENAEFARRVSDAGLTWVGPSSEAISALGDKVSARAIAVAVGAPLVRGSGGPISSAEDVRSFADVAGFPVAVKASHGGGGRGMRIVRSSEQIDSQLQAAQNEALGAFGNDECFVEQYLDRPRHVETQCLADRHGNVVVVGTRDCSMQRRHQKLLEEAPAPGLSAEQTAELVGASRSILSHVGYVGAATCEFLISQEGVISFLEVNTRIQVEHTVTEVVSGVDLIEQQFRIARGEALAVQENIANCVAIEYRINSEDPALGFMPSTGAITEWTEPSGPWVRVDAGVGAGDVVTGSFDSMLAKLVVCGPTRESALDRSRRALREFRVGGLRTTIPFFEEVIEQSAVRCHGSDADGIYTNWVEEELLAGASVQRITQRQTEHEQSASGRARRQTSEGTGFRIRLDGRELQLELPEALLAALGTQASALPAAPRIDGVNTRRRSPATDTVGIPVHAPARAVVVSLQTTEGATVSTGDPLATIEVMKMEHTVLAPSSGRVEGLVSLGSEVSPSEPILRLV